MNRFSWLVFITIIALLSGCSNHKVRFMGEERFAAKTSADEVKLYVTSINQPHVEFAWVDSFSSVDEDPDTRRRQLADMREKARRIGADAVINVRSMTNEIKNVMLDEASPIPSWTQGEWNSFFLRGVAVRLLEPEETDDFDFADFESEGTGQAESLEDIDPDQIPRVERLTEDD